MKRRPLRRVIRAIAALVALAALLGGAPYALITWGHWPITGVPTWDQLTDLPNTLVSDTAIFGTMTLVAWAVWAAFTVSVVVELVAQGRGQGVELRGIRPVQHVARTLVASLVMSASASSLAGSTAPGIAFTSPVAAAHQPQLGPHAAPGDAAGDQRETPQHLAGQPSPGEWQTATVGPGDSAWSIAERYYGSGERWRDLWADNRLRTQPDGRTWSSPDDPLQPGWSLLIRPGPAQPDRPTGPAIGAPSGAQVVAVASGDHLWALARERLTETWGREPTDEEISPYWQLIVEANQTTLASGDPDLVFPGERVMLLPAPEPPSFAEPVPVPRQLPPPALPTPEAEPRAEPTAPPTTTTPTSTSATTASEQSSPTSRSPATPTPRPNEPEERPQGGTDRAEPGDIAEVVLPLVVSASLAAVALRVLARRRRSRRRSIRPGTALGPRPAEDLEIEFALAAASEGVAERAWSAAQALTGVWRTLAEPPTVLGLVVSPSGAVTLLLSEPTAPIDPFVADPSDPAAWLLPADRIDLDADRGPPVLETLVTVGRSHDGDWVFLDLESLGAVSVVGSREQARRLVRSIAAELVWQPLHHFVNVTVAGDGIDVPEVVEQDIVTVDRLDEEQLRLIEQLAADTTSLLADEHVASTAAARVHGVPRDGLWVSAFIVDEGADPVLLQRAAARATPGGRGLVLLALDPLESPAVQLVVDESGMVTIPHLDITVQAAQLGTDDLRRVDDMLSREPDTIESTAAGEPPETPEAESSNGSAEPWQEPSWEYCVRIFADCAVEKRDGEKLSFRYGENPDVPNKNTNRGPELLAFLALQTDRAASLREIAEALWWGRRIGDRTVGTLVSGTRRTLGGTRHLSHAESGRYALGETVMTDVELLDSALAYARQVASRAPDLAVAALRPQLARIEAPAFRTDYLGSGLSEWAAAKRVFDRLDALIVDSAILVARLCSGRDDDDGLENARWAVDQAAHACPTNEALIRTAMDLDMQAGDRASAARRYDALEAHLVRDELEPEPETQELHKKLTRPDRIG